MGIEAGIEPMLFKHNLNGHPTICKLILSDQEVGRHVLEMMDKDKQRIAETKQAQFNRLWDVFKRQSNRKRKDEADSDKLEEWKQEYKAQYKNPITPERIKEMLDDMLDKGEISEKEHEYGTIGLKWMFDYEPAEEEVGVPF